MKLVLLRHGESIWNKENKFTGWTDVDLSSTGIKEAKRAGKLLKENNFNFDIAYTSVLKRAIDTLDYVLKELGTNIPVVKDYHLNERCYGALQGFNKDEIKEKYGEKQVLLWRRSADVRPPALTKDDKRFPGNDPKYKDIPINKLPLTENLNDTIIRVREYFDSKIILDIKNNKNVLIVAHGNSLRGLVKYLEKLSDEEVINLELKTGVPYIYDIDENLNILSKNVLE